MEHDQNQKETTTNYNLNSDAVEALVSASPETVPDYSEAELKKYRGRGRFHLPNWLKMIAIKAWFAGAVCFFILWGLGTYIGGLDMLVATGIAMGMVTDLLTNNVLRFVEDTPGANNGWMLIPPKGVRSFVLNILYGCVIMACVFMLYNAINYALIAITGQQGTIYLGVEPLLFGVMCMGVDLLFIGSKRLLVRIFRDAAATARDSK
jgi:hypothetical protein